jgi:hypothetical protein
METVMEIRKTCSWTLFITIIALLILYFNPAYAADELFLTGIIKSIDNNTKTVVVDVQSSSCHGIRTFVVNDPDALYDLINKKIDFSIDSSNCKRGEVYKMFPGGREAR